MRNVMRGVFAVCAIAGFAISALGQIFGAPVSGQGIGVESRAGAGPHPYTAQFKIVSEQTLANGTTITRESTETQAVDSQGRRLSVVSTQATGQMPEHSTFHVFDPVTKTNTNWTSVSKTATVQKMPQAEPGQARTCWATGNSTVASAIVSGERSEGASTTVGTISSGTDVQMVRARPAVNETKNENLGKQVFQGVEATGRRTTVTTPAGAIGNDAPLVRTTEVWNARSIGLTVRTVSDDPQTGKRTKDLVELNQSEPDPAMFQPPEGYEIRTVEFHEIPCSQ